MRTQRPQDKSASPPRKGATERERELRQTAASDENLREQSKTETEESPYLDTEGGD
jgi:hypothetical protein